jgi:O-succinylbenzoic acid--CoA ligase
MKNAYHPAFRIAGQAFEYADLGEVGYSLVKEGDTYERDIGDFLIDWVSDRDHVVQQSSGSTGAPKPIRLLKEHMVHSARATGEFMGLGPGSKAMVCLPMSAIAGKMMLVRAMVLGWDLYMVPPVSDPLREVSGSFDFAAMVPLQVEKSLKKLSRIGKLIVGGAPVLPALLARLPKKGPEIWQTYGMTETASHIALRKLQTVPAGEDPEAVLPPYTAMEGIRLELDARGCLVIHAPGWSDHPITTNDLVALESETTFRWLGRIDHVVNSGGVKLMPDLLEIRMSPYLEHPFFLCGMDDATLGQKLVLFVEGPHDPKAVRRALEESGKFDKYELPREIYCVPSFAETMTGKVDRLKTIESFKNQ